jgi:hypothetical protein
VIKQALGRLCLTDETLDDDVFTLLEGWEWKDWSWPKRPLPPPTSIFHSLILAVHKVAIQRYEQAKLRKQDTTAPPLYTHLDPSMKCIRLLCLSSRFQAGGVSARLHTFPITKCPPYAALSYTWQPRYPLQHMAMNGQDITVGRNLFDALHVISGSIDSDINTRIWKSFE